ncbi:MAG TPA: inositol oxygenase family protein [Pirellulales bacterium]|jgi:inositol oxygenase|nr:inositol oxygenase family protein [Pirellulales bacterium]
MVDRSKNPDSSPLNDLDQWEDDLRRRYPDPAGEGSTTSTKKKEEFRDHRMGARPEVTEFYRLNHKYQTVDFVRAKRAEFLPLSKRKMGLWDGLEFLNTLVDQSDPDTRLAQIEHLLQTAEAIRRDGHPNWFILTGLIHDFGKVLCLFGEPQWAVVGDTFPVGCAYSDKIVFPEFLADNPDSQVSQYQTECGIYEPGCGLDNVLMSWGHDEYMYHIVKDYLPLESLYMIRYHSFYPGHKEGAYQHLMNAQDRKYFNAVKAFSPYDLYTKAAERPKIEELRPYYEDLWAEFFPPQLAF